MVLLLAFHSCHPHCRHIIRDVAGEKITDKGLGNGTSMIIMIGIRPFAPGIRTRIGSQIGTTRGAGGLLIILIEVLS